MNISAIELINTIKKIRKEKGLSQFEIAKRWEIVLDENNIIKCGYDVFGKEYGFMLRNDLHDKNSIEHKLLQEQILLDKTSESFLYGDYQISYSMEKNKLYEFSQQFKTNNELNSIK